MLLTAGMEGRTRLASSSNLKHNAWQEGELISNTWAATDRIIRKGDTVSHEVLENGTRQQWILT